MFKSFIAFAFLVSFMTQTFSRALIVFDYYTNTAAYIAKCENKAKPQLHCNGKCGLAQKIQLEEKKNEQQPERKAENKYETFLSCKSFFANAIQPAISATAPLFGPSASGKIISMPRTYFHPPDRQPA